MKTRLRKYFQVVVLTTVTFIVFSIIQVVAFSFINPPLTPLMVIRYIQHDSKLGERKIEKKWKDLDEINPTMILAVVSAEDNNFPSHFGIDWDAIKTARQKNKKGKKIHGGSTITQQTAKNVFLVPNRSYIRKGFELYYTYLIEIFWSKERIMEVYLNVVELGRGVYGVEAASQKYFKKSASKLTRGEAALITSALPSPRKRNLAKPTSYMYKYQARVLNLMRIIGKVEL